jgi:hypothetical protein
MEMADHLIQIAAKAYELAIKKAGQVVALVTFGADGMTGLKKKCAPKMNGTHADGLGASTNAFKLAVRETEIKLPAPRLGF